MVANSETSKFAATEQPKSVSGVNPNLETEKPVTRRSTKRLSSAKFKSSLWHDWLLGKAQGRRFDVGGDASMENVGMGTSNSANHTPNSSGLDPDSNLTGQTPVISGFNTKTTSLSKLKSIILHDWWLMKAHGKGLAVGGVTSTERERIFFSAMIIKRHVTNVFETEDGIKIIVSGFINRSRTQENGFPLEVCDRFEFGFPYDWEKYTAYCCEVENTNGAMMKARRRQFKEDVTRHKISQSQVKQMQNGENRILDVPVRKRDEKLPSCCLSVKDVNIPTTCDDLPEKNTDQSPLSASKEKKDYLPDASKEKKQKLTEHEKREDCSRRVTRSMSKRNRRTSQSQVKQMHNGKNGNSDVPVRKQDENLRSCLFVEDVNPPNTCDDLPGINTDQSPLPTSKDEKDYSSGVSKDKTLKYTKRKMPKDGSRRVTRSKSKRNRTTML